MKKRKVGVFVESFRLPTRDGIKKAAELGVDGIQFFCTWGELTPEKMTGTARKDLKGFVASQGLALASICCDYGRNYLNAATNDETVAMAKKSIDLAVDLGTKVLTTHIGTIPDDGKAAAWKAGVEALRAVSAYAESRGVVFAAETGPEAPAVMRRFFDEIGTRGIGANYDPANLVMGGFDQLGGVDLLGKYIVHTHAKDGVRVNGQAKEVPLGEGSVDFPRYLAKLDAVGFDGFLTIEREVGENPASDVAQAVKFLRGLK